MQRWATREELVFRTVTLAQQGMKSRAIARTLQVSRNTVKKILAAHEQARHETNGALTERPARAPRESKLDDFRSRIDELFDRFPEITAQRVFEELRAHGFAGGYTIVKDFVRRSRPKRPVEPSRETEVYGPGKMAESDWSPHVIAFTHAPRATVHVFAYVLCHSRRKSFGLYERCDLFALMDGHVATFTRFEGAAEVCKYDSQKTVVLGWEGRQPIYNPRFLAFATYYEFRPLACRPFHPNDKPHVERAFWEFERSFLCGRNFRDLEDMRRQLAEWQETTCDVRPHKKLKKTPLELFVEEHPHLIALPRCAYDTARVIYRLCSIDGFIAWDGNRYAIPYDHVTDILPVRVTQRELFVYAANLELIAKHELLPRSAGKDVDPLGFHRPKWKHAPAADLDQLQKTFEGMGENSAAYFGALRTTAGRQCGHQARQILLLRERFSTDDLVAALGHAHAFGAYTHQAIARILEARAKPRSLEEYVTEETARRFGEIVSSTKVGPRDLDEYDRLPMASPRMNEETP